MNYQEGEILLFNKAYEWSSFDLVNKVRSLICRTQGIKKLKVGHAGTLDPLATGLLLICTGKFTKRITELQDMPKEYVTSIRLGATTPSFDKETEEDAFFETSHINENLVREVLQTFLGEQEQVPPLFSAIKLKGKRAYEYARKGEEVALKSKQISIHEIELLTFAKHEICVRILCSKGTYIRSLARDIGQALDTGGYLTSLERTKIGAYHVNDAMTIEDFNALITENE